MQSNGLSGMDLISWETWKRRNPNLQHFVVWDGIKGWVREIVTTTLQHYGYKMYIQDYDYGLCQDIKPKQLAIKLIREYQKFYGNDWWKDKKLVYYHCRGSRNGFMDNLYVLCRENSSYGKDKR